MASEPGLVIGIDGGATATRAVLADRDGAVLGRGQAGTGNPKSAGLEAALAEVRRAIEGAFAAAKRMVETVNAICLALAGAGRSEDRPPIEDWVKRERVAERVAVVPDAVAVLAAGSPGVVGVSIIAGTGSMAYGRNEAGSEERAGGWGSLFGDEGSGYAMAVAGLRAAVQAADGRGPGTGLLPGFLDRLKLSEAGGLVTTLYSPEWDKRRVAALATVVTACADAGDDVAKGLMLAGAEELVEAAAAVEKRLVWKGKPVVAMAGGLVVNVRSYREMVEAALKRAERFGEAVVVAEPALGAMAIARRVARGERW